MSPAGVSLQAAHSGEARVPKSIIQDGKKGLRGLMSVFMEIQPVTGFVGETIRGETGEVPGIIAGIK